MRLTQKRRRFATHADRPMTTWLVGDIETVPQSDRSNAQPLRIDRSFMTSDLRTEQATPQTGAECLPKAADWDRLGQIQDGLGTKPPLACREIQEHHNTTQTQTAKRHSTQGLQLAHHMNERQPPLRGGQHPKRPTIWTSTSLLLKDPPALTGIEWCSMK